MGRLVPKAPPQGPPGVPRTAGAAGLVGPGTSAGSVNQGLVELVERWRLRFALPYLVLLPASWIAYAFLWHSPLVATTAWDGQHYLAIAAHGYPQHLDTTYSNLAFFPGMPLAVAALHLLGPSIDLSGFLVSFAAGAVFCWAGAKLVERQYGPAAATRASMLLAVCPGSFLFGISYADPFAVALMACCLVSLEAQQWRRGGVIGALACASSPAALPIVLAAAVYRFKADRVEPAATRNTARRAFQSLALACSMLAGVAAFMAYLWFRTGVLTAWFSAEGRGWGQGLDLASPLQHLTTAASGSAIPAIEISCACLALGGVACMARARVPAGWWAVSLPVLAIGLFARGSWLDPRILFNAFPLAVSAAVVVRRRPFALLLVGSVIAMQLCLVAYTVMWGNIVAQP